MKHLVVIFLVSLLAFSLITCTQEEAEEQQTMGEEEFSGVVMKDVEEFYYVALPHTGPYEDHETVIGQFMEQINRQQIMPNGPMMGIYYSDPEQVQAAELEWVIAFPVQDSMEVEKPLISGKWNKGRVLSYLYVGPYDQTAEVYEIFDKYMAEYDFVPAGPAVERFLDTNPMEIPEDSLRTEIWFPVTKKEI